MSISPTQPKILKAGILPMVCLAAGLVFAAPAQAEWANLRGPNMDGAIEGVGMTAPWPDSGLERVWAKRLGTGFASTTVVGDHLYTAGFSDDEDHVYCLNVKTGEQVWQFSYPETIFDRSHEGGPASTPASDGEHVYILSRTGKFICIDAQTGEEQWRHHVVDDWGSEVPRWGYSGSPLIVDDKVLVDAGLTVAMDKKTGEVIWKSKNYGSAYNTPMVETIHGQKVVITFNGTGLTLLDYADGAELAVYPWPTNYSVNSCTPILHDNHIFFSSSYGQGGAMVKVNDDFSLDAVWETKEFNNHFNASVLHDGYLYGYHGHYGRAENALRCVDFETGEVMWEEPSISRGSVLLIDGHVVALSGNGELVLIEPNPEEFTAVSRFQALGGKCWTESAVADGMIFVRNNEAGNLFAYRLTGQG